MDYKAVEAKWQTYWEQTGLARFDWNAGGEKLYCMEMFAYPSGANLHAGHWFNFALSDSWARFKKMQGYNVFHPTGFDAFGLPAENYAIKLGTHPRISTYANIETMRRQLRAMGGMYDWEHEVVTCDPAYYKWTQWVFLQLYHKGLAYQKNAPVNWCPKCQTVLANEQAAGGACERCESPVVQKSMKQWFFRITDYAQELLDCLDGLDWPGETKAKQRNWIGRSEGALIKFALADGSGEIEVFTTRVDTLFGATYVVLAPEHELVETITAPEQAEAVRDYVKNAGYSTEIERLSTLREKTGVFTGAYAINPVNGEKVPVWISDYVLTSYGTGAIMAVPAHDQRDYMFATKFGLPIIPVLAGGDISKEAFEGDGPHINCGYADGMNVEDAKAAILGRLAETGSGSEKVNYKLRDWLISRQRYWGAPIPIIYCGKCGTVPVPEADLPVELPFDVEFRPEGKSPLYYCDEFRNTRCPVCGAPAQREVDTMDTFMCSSWYELRYPDANNAAQAFDPALLSKMLPVDKYVGGKEHATMHLIYARFICKALRDCGWLDIGEPFPSLVHQGIVLGADGQKMSKSKGNTISPDKYIDAHGSDVFRAYLMFGFNYVDGGPWSDDGIAAVAAFVRRFVALAEQVFAMGKPSSEYGEAEKELDYALHSAIQGATSDYNAFKFNTAIAKMMILYNEISGYMAPKKNTQTLQNAVRAFVQMMAPAAPHVCEELWQLSGAKTSVFLSRWPQCDEAKLKRDTVEIPVQVNGKLRKTIEAPAQAGREEILDMARRLVPAGATIVKEVYVPGRIVNFVVRT